MEYIENELWAPYYEELDPDKRMELFNELKTKADDGLCDFRMKLYTIRYTNPKKPGKRVDNGVWHMVVMPSHVKNIINFRQQTIDQIKESMDGIGVNLIENGDIGQVSAVYWEMRNAAKRYFSTCHGPNYGRRFFGIKAATEFEQLDKTAKDVWTMCIKVPEKYNLVEETRIFSEAVRDEFTHDSQQAFDLYKKHLEEGK